MNYYQIMKCISLLLQSVHGIIIVPFSPFVTQLFTDHLWVNKGIRLVIMSIKCHQFVIKVQRLVLFIHGTATFPASHLVCLTALNWK